MKQARHYTSGQLPEKDRHKESDHSLESNETIAWRSVEDELWIPYRIRGSWRGGVLG